MIWLGNWVVSETTIYLRYSPSSISSNSKFRPPSTVHRPLYPTPQSVLHFRGWKQRGEVRILNHKWDYQLWLHTLPRANEGALLLYLLCTVKETPVQQLSTVRKLHITRTAKKHGRMLVEKCRVLKRPENQVNTRPPSLIVAKVGSISVLVPISCMLPKLSSIRFRLSPKLITSGWSPHALSDNRR